MTLKKAIIILIVFFISIPSCVYEFEPELNSNYSSHLVVFASITNENKPVEVSLSRTGNFEDNFPVPEINASVFIVSDNGNEIQLYEYSDGKYKSLEPYSATEGVGYKIRIHTIGGEIYESNYEKLPDIIEVKNVGFEFVSIPTDNLDENVEACQFYVDVESSSLNYLRFEMIETWEIKMPYIPNWYFNGVEFIEPNLPVNCWVTKKIDDVKILNTNLLGSGTFSKLPLTQVTYETNRFYIKYCLTVKQHNMSKRVYEYWKSQEENIGTNTLYSKNLFQTRGNINNVNDPDEPVIGIFEVSSVSEKHVFVDDVPASIYPGFDNCKPYNPPLDTDYMFGYYLVIIDPIGTTAVISKKCVDCTKVDGNPEKPDFWE